MTTTPSDSYTDMIKREQLWRALENPEYRRAYAADVGTGLAFQIRTLREARGWTQEYLALQTGKRQETISQWENPDYGRYSLKTLTELAAALDVALVTRFAPFSELVNWAVALDAEHLAPPSFEEELGFRNLFAHRLQRTTIATTTREIAMSAIDSVSNAVLLSALDNAAPTNQSVSEEKSYAEAA